MLEIFFDPSAGIYGKIHVWLVNKNSNISLAFSLHKTMHRPKIPQRSLVSFWEYQKLSP